MVGLRKDNNAYWILVGTILFSMVLILVNWVVIERFQETDTNSYITEGDMETDSNILQQFWSWVTGYFTPVINALTLNIELLNRLGFLGSLIKTTVGVLVTVGIVEIVWIG